MNVLFAIATGIMFGLGIFQILRRDLVKSAMGVYILFTAINLFFLAAGAFNGEVPPYANRLADGQSSDPLVQALILTAVVISFGSYALLLGLIRVASRRYHTVESDKMNDLRR